MTFAQWSNGYPYPLSHTSTQRHAKFEIWRFEVLVHLTSSKVSQTNFHRLTIHRLSRVGSRKTPPPKGYSDLIPSLVHASRVAASEEEHDWPCIREKDRPQFKPFKKALRRRRDLYMIADWNKCSYPRIGTKCTFCHPALYERPSLQIVEAWNG